MATVAENGTNVAFRANLALALQNIGMVDRASVTWQSICELAAPFELVLEERRRMLQANRQRNARDGGESAGRH